MTRRQLPFVLALAVAIAPAPTSSQSRDKSSITLAGARRVIAAALAEARLKQAPGGVIAVVDDGGHLVALERIDSTFAAGANVSIGKARTAALFQRPTSFFEDVIRKGRTPMVSLDDFTPLQGGVPIIVGGQIIGAVGVSGAASAQQDEELALAGAAALSDANGTAARPDVSYWAAGEVKAAFATGAVLFDGGGRNYMVHASRRDKPGLAEVHALDTDIIHVLDGTATVVTGGEVVNGKTIEPGEVRGTAIRQGDTRRLSAGDVLIVPNGVPHWFTDVSVPFLYYVVKVR